jgi:hypothetical protein
MASWQGSEIEVKAEVVPRYLWTTASIDVYLDGARVLRTGGVWRLRDSRTIDFHRNGVTHTLTLRWKSPSRGMDFAYVVSIGGQDILDSTVRPTNWPMFFVPYATPLVILVGYRFLTGGNLVTEIARWVGMAAS